MPVDKKEALFQDRLGYHFKDPALLHQALIHTSFVNEAKQASLTSNERLEFLGDAVLELIVSDLLFHKKQDFDEGVLTKQRIQLVCESSFAFLARQWGLPDLLLLGRGEEAQGGRAKDSILSDAFEAVCGALYCDGGYDFLYQQWARYLPDLLAQEEASHALYQDYKSAFQEWAHQAGKSFRYELVESAGPAHEPSFTMALLVEGKEVARGQGRSKKLAEQAAAQEALKDGRSK